MTMMHWLWLGAIVMLVLSLAALLPPLLREHAVVAPDEDKLRAIYQAQLAELEQERTRGNLADAEHAQASPTRISQRLGSEPSSTRS